MSDKKILILLIVLLLLTTSVNAFDLFKNSEPEPLCPSTTGVIIDVIQNPTEEISILKTGTASPFSSVFLYKNLIYTYVTPRSKTPAGTYTLTLTASDEEESKSLNHELEIIECQEFEISQDKNKASVCPCETDKIDLTIQNTGKLTDTYTLTTTGPGSNLVLFSEDKVTLKQNEAKTIPIYLQDTCNHQGQQDFTITVTPKKARSEKSITSTLNIDNCYDFSADIEKTFVELCENSGEEIELTLENEGTSSNTYTLDVNGPSWANLEKTQITIPSKGKATTSLILNPYYNTADNYNLKLNIISEKGDFQLQADLEAQVNQCTNVFVDLQERAETCNGIEYELPVTIQNTGELDKDFNLGLTGPTWSSLSQGKVSLNEGEETELTLSLSPPQDTQPETQKITVRASALDTEEIFHEATLTLKTRTQEDCYKAKLEVERDDIKLYNDATATIPITLENQGTQDSIYELSLSGTASEFTEIVPLSTGIKVELSKTEQVYLYIAPNPEIELGTYTATISARLEDSEILDSKTITIEITDNPEDVFETEPPLEDITGEVVANETIDSNISFFEKIIGFFKELLPTEKPAENITTENTSNNETIEPDFTEPENITLDSGNETENLTMDPENETENITIDINTNNETENITDNTTEESNSDDGISTITLDDDTEVTYFDFDLQNPITYLTEEAELVAFDLEGKRYSSSLDTLEETFIQLAFTPGPVFVHLNLDEPREVDMTGDNINDFQLTLNEFKEGKAEITYELLEGAGGIVLEENTGLEDETIFLDSEGNPLDQPTNPEGNSTLTNGILTQLASYIVRNQTTAIIVIIALLLLAIIVKLKLHKKVGDFFEEEEEQKPEVEVETTEIITPEEPKEEPEEKPKEKPKENKKKKDKKDDDDDEEFEIIH
tara:strand:+ start:6459 stop:9167 length:2709 start_codon:yes stop_codon:yes gene_type:complete